MKKVITLLSLAALISVVAFSCKKDDPKTEDPSTTTNDKKYVLVIDNGAQTMEAGQTPALKAHLVSTSGEVVSVSGVSWSSNIGTVTGANFSATSESAGSISASVTYEGLTYTASVPISVQPPAGTLLFGVVPSAIIWSTNSGPIQLNTVYIGSQNATFAFSSNSSDIASVSSSGLVTFNKVGTTTVKVTATIGGQKSTINVPVMVVGEPEVPLPVTRIVVNPALGELFRGETLQMNAKAYNSKGEDVTSTVTFNYVVEEKLEDNEEPSNPIKIDASGKVTAQSIGDAYVKVTANGILGQAEITVNPDTIITVYPFFVNFGKDISQSPPVRGPSAQALAAKMQRVDRVKYRAKDASFLVDLPTPSNLQWMLPQTGIAQIDDIFKVVTLTEATTTSVKVKPIQNKIGSTVVIAHAGIYGGAASISVYP